MGAERVGAATRYARAAVRHPNRAIKAALSELTGFRRTVNICLGDVWGGDICGELPDRLTRFLYMMDGIKEYEPETRAMMNHVVGEGDTVLVVGAHIGTYAVYAR